MSNRPSYYTENAPKLQDLLDELGMEYEKFGQHDDQWRVYGATHIIDIWPARMIYHRIGGETVKSNEPYCRDMDWQFDREQVERLLKTGSHEVQKRKVSPEAKRADIVSQTTLFMADVGFYDDTVIYQLVPREVARMNGMNARGIAELLQSFGAQHVLVDTVPEIHDLFRALGMHVIKGSIPIEKNKR